MKSLLKTVLADFTRRYSPSNTRYQITVEDFDNAVKQKWNVFTCIVSQCAMRYNYLPGIESPASKLRLKLNYREPVKGITEIFDNHFRNPGDEAKPELVALRASLPIDL